MDEAITASRICNHRRMLLEKQYFSNRFHDGNSENDCTTWNHKIQAENNTKWKRKDSHFSGRGNVTEEVFTEISAKN
ncbi:MAG: hypothetical protein OSJ52_10650 [Lachnospiraceae bacterium]|nr:hypothetical protein [Lachnospiraceae bacterium]